MSEKCFSLMIYVEIILLSRWAQNNAIYTTHINYHHKHMHFQQLGFIASIVMAFVVNPVYASTSFAISVMLFIFIMFRTPGSSWGYISQALIFHQVLYFFFQHIPILFSSLEMYNVYCIYRIYIRVIF